MFNILQKYLMESLHSRIRCFQYRDAHKSGGGRGGKFTSRRTSGTPRR